MSEEKKNEILGEKLDAEELDAVSGGHLFGAGGNGNCTSSYYEGGCHATVEKGSLCRSSDFCLVNDKKYSTLIVGDEPRKRPRK